jgi:hypothetical protein
MPTSSAFECVIQNQFDGDWHFDFRDEFLAQPAKRKSVKACRRTSCDVKGTYNEMAHIRPVYLQAECAVMVARPI